MSDREYTQIIDALRWNGKEYKGSTMDEDDKQLFCDAADAIEELMAMLDLARDSNSGLRKELDDSDAEIDRLVAEIDRKDKALQEWAKTWEKRKDNAIRHICDHCDTPIEIRLKEGACEDCPIKIVVKEIFEEGEQHD